MIHGLKICVKQDECDNVMMKIKVMAFFVFSVAVVEKKVNKYHLNDDKDGKDEIQERNAQGKNKIF